MNGDLTKVEQRDDALLPRAGLPLSQLDDLSPPFCPLRLSLSLLLVELYIAQVPQSL